ncbi:YraN family protein [Mangrovivirga cuniculi]|uniref:YraN family protein n=1 Tax=Mangrovivirga cuniculi TaxID=2715131 RepID=UPI001FEAB273|nr:YraN family protein [Mangrovivirga cuniculi]
MERIFNRNRQIGNKGEEKASLFLISLGYDILETNYRYRRSEIDIIAIKEKTIHFIEVKTRSDDRFGNPEEAVNNKKIESIMTVADHYVHENNWEGNIQFDVISILIGKELRIDHFEDIS